jgi:hypothetical protein
MFSNDQLTERLLDACSPACLARAQRRQAEGGVETCRVAEVDGLLVLTGVIHDDEQSWRVWISLDDGELKGDCSCEGPEVCEHMAALVLAQSGAEKRGPGSGRRQVEARPMQAAATADRFMAYLLRLSDDGKELSVCPSRVSLTSDGAVATPYSLVRLADDVQPDYVDEEDLAILHSLADHALSISGLVWYPMSRTSAGLLREIIATGRCYWQDIDGPMLSLDEPVEADVKWDLLTSGWQSLGWQTDAGAGEKQLPMLPPWLLDPVSGKCRVMGSEIDDELAGRLLLAGPVPPDGVDAVIKLLSSAPASFPRPRRLEIVQCATDVPRPRLTLVQTDVGRVSGFAATAAARLEFCYGELKLDWDDEYDTRLLGADRVATIRRDREFESTRVAILETLGLVPLHTCSGRDYQPGDGGLWVAADERRALATWIAVQRKLDEMSDAGWEVVVAPDFAPELVVPEAWYGDLAESGEQVVELDLGIESQGQRHSLLPALLDWLERAPRAIIRQLLTGTPSDEEVTLALDDRRVVQVSLQRLSAALRALTDSLDGQVKPEDGRVRLHRARLAEVAAAGEGWSFSAGDSLAGLGQRLARYEEIERLDPPEGFRAELRDYQRFGLGWLQFLRDSGFGGILADDMGLGKTIQTLAHILTEKRSGRMDRPCLVIAPTSLLFNWRAEARRFAPELEVLILHGPRRKGLFGWIGHSDLVLTSYPLMLRDGERLARQSWHLLILDEAQAIKNPRARISRQVRDLDARHRLCLTGTPLENRLEELWSQFDFLMPGLLGSQTDFRRRFSAPIERHQDADRRELLARRVRPFVLRRSKEEVAPELPAKTEIVRTVALEEGQQRLYERVRVMLHERVRQAVQSRGVERSRLVVLDALLRLRQVCCDPRLIGDTEGRERAGSAKLELLLDLLPELVAEGRRILLFSQFVGMLSLIEQAVKEQGIDYVKLTGRTRNREKVVGQFQAGAAPLFLISLKAGGVGLNLTRADTVIHYDPWWNPAAEDQATDRAHRIGQEQKVFVYRLLTENTIEQKVAELQESKRGLVDGLFGGERVSTIGSEEIEALFAPLESLT